MYASRKAGSVDSTNARLSSDSLTVPPASHTGRATLSGHSDDGGWCRETSLSDLPRHCRSPWVVYGNHLPVASASTRSRDRRIRRLGLLTAAACLATLLTGCDTALSHHGNGDHSVAIAAEISANSCEATNFAITNKIDGSKTRIYDCSMSDGTEKCVTEENGLIQDRTEVAKLLFASTLGTDGPTCAAGT